MSFIVRAAQMDDLTQLTELARQFNLLNLPGDKNVLSAKIEKSISSFAGELPKAQSEYLFILEDIEEEKVVGSSLVMAKHGNDDVPHTSFKVLKRDHFSKDLGIGFIHHVLRFNLDYEGPTEIGGLLVDKTYRRRPERLGKQISLSRFLYIALNPERFESRILCELTPPLTEEGRSEFWEALGRRFTGLNYTEADLLSQSHREFIESLFPLDDIYLCLLDSKARTVLGRVGENTKPAQHLLESIGFQYLDEVDPFDGGPHYGAATKDVLPIKLGKKLKIADFKDASFQDKALIGIGSDDFKAALVSYDIRGEEISIPAKQRQQLNLNVGDIVFWAPFEYDRKKEQT